MNEPRSENRTMLDRLWLKLVQFCSIDIEPRCWVNVIFLICLFPAQQVGRPAVVCWSDVNQINVLHLLVQNRAPNVGSM